MLKIFGSAGALPSRKTIHHSLLAIRQSLFAAVFILVGNLFSHFAHRLGSGQFVCVKGKPFVASSLVGDGCLTAFGDKPRRYLYHFFFAHYRLLHGGSKMPT